MRAVVTTARIELGPLSRVALPSRPLSSRSRDRERHGFHAFTQDTQVFPAVLVVAS